jgi:hypothetical protein
MLDWQSARSVQFVKANAPQRCSIARAASRGAGCQILGCTDGPGVLRTSMTCGRHPSLDKLGLVDGRSTVRRMSNDALTHACERRRRASGEDSGVPAGGAHNCHWYKSLSR